MAKTEEIKSNPSKYYFFLNARYADDHLSKIMEFSGNLTLEELKSLIDTIKYYD